MWSARAAGWEELLALTRAMPTRRLEVDIYFGHTARTVTLSDVCGEAETTTRVRVCVSVCLCVSGLCVYVCVRVCACMSIYILPIDG